MTEIQIKSTKWNLTHLFEGESDPRIAEKRKMWEQSVQELSLIHI